MPRESRTARMHRRRREQIAEQAEARRQFEARPVSERLQILHDDISAYADEIAALFNCPMQVTIIARSPDNPDREVLITSDTWEGIDSAVVRAKSRETPEPVCICGHLVKHHNPGGCAGGSGAGGALAYAELPCACMYVVERR